MGTRGGVAFYSDGLVINNEISSNHCESIYGYGVGGGIRLLGGTTKILNNNIDLNSSISINSEGFAGGISCSWANTVIDSNNITNNFVAGVSFCKGAAIFFDLDNDAYWAVVKNNYISGNYHTNGICYGGAIGMGKSSPDIYNNVITNNSANYGGALSAVVNSKPIIINNTIVSNTASNVGGGIYSNQSTLAVLNSIIWNNSAPAGPQIYGSADVQYSDVEGGYTGIGNIDIYPEFVDMVNENYHLSDNSPFIGAGIDSLEIGGIWYYAPSCDFDGNPRPNPDITKPDMGAYENPREVPLPVELTSFTAITQIGKVILNWSTATEINNLGFEIERKIISSETNRDWLLLALEKDMEQQQNQENILLWMI